MDNKTSNYEIERWSRILETQKDGLERLRSYMASIILGRHYGESLEDRLERGDFTCFYNWALKYTKK